MKPVWTRKQTEKFLGETFTDRISWTAARIILEGITADDGYVHLGSATQARIERFLASHPAPAIGGNDAPAAPERPAR